MKQFTLFAGNIKAQKVLLGL